jgi:hypothetical protein
MRSGMPPDGRTGQRENRTVRGYGVIGGTLWALLTWATAGAGEATEPVVVYPAQGGFEEVLENIRMAVIERGMLVSGSLHVQDMLDRTGKDLGFEHPVYLKAESVEFCSAALSHRMIADDPRNLTVCPFTVAAYVLASEPQRVYVAYGRKHLAGKPTGSAAAVQELLDGIARQAAE